MNINHIRNNIVKKLNTPQIKEQSFDRHNNYYNHFYQSRYWKDLRSTYMASHPLCENCLKHGLYTSAEELHHAIPFSTGTTEREKWRLLLDPSNVVALCSDCHNKIHRLMKAKHSIIDVRDIDMIPDKMEVAQCEAIAVKSFSKYN